MAYTTEDVQESKTNFCGGCAYSDHFDHGSGELQSPENEAPPCEVEYFKDKSGRGRACNGKIHFNAEEVKSGGTAVLKVNIYAKKQQRSMCDQSIDTCKGPTTTHSIDPEIYNDLDAAGSE